MKGPLTVSSVVADRYVVKGWLGAGGMQYVYLANDRLFNRDVALKTPKDDGGERRFRQSAVMSAKVNHSNVAKTLDYFELPDARPYLVEEQVAGLDLQQVMGRGLSYLPPSTCARILHKLAKGLAASHYVEVVHRDLKPSNIMISGGLAFDEVKITDFGIAKLAEGEIGAWALDKGAGTSSKTVLGAIPYMSPESIEAFNVASKPSDVWAIAAVVYELLSGNLPFGNGLKSVANILHATPPPSPSQINAVQFKPLGSELYRLLLRCFQKQPELRPTADDLVRECEMLCYSVDKYETGIISRIQNAYTGFIAPERGKGLMYFRQNFYGAFEAKAGTPLWFGRHHGDPSDRAFPVVCLKTKT